MNKPIMVSIICTAYNHELYIRDAIESFLEQVTNFEYEILIHDDASTDKTAEIIKEYEKKYPEIVKPIYQKENQYSKNVKITTDIQIPRARGKYVAICEGDDFWIDKYKLQKQVDFMEMYSEYSVCTHAYKRIDMNDNIEKVISSFEYSGTITTQQVIEGGGGLFATNSILFRKELANVVPPFRRNTSFGDYPLIIHLALVGKVFYMNEVLSAYRYMVKDSWSAKNLNDFSNKQRHVAEIRSLLEEVDRYSNYKYTSIINRTIDKNGFLCFFERYSFIRLSREFKYYYTSLSFKKKLYFLIKKYVPFILKIIGV